MLDDVLSIIQADLIDLASKTVVVCAGLVGVGLTFFGIKWVTSKIIGFFSIIGGDSSSYYDDDPVSSGRFTAEEWAEFSDHSI